MNKGILTEKVLKICNLENQFTWLDFSVKIIFDLLRLSLAIEINTHKKDYSGLRNLVKFYHTRTDLSSLGVPWHTQCLADQLTLFQPRRGQIMPT